MKRDLFFCQVWVHNFIRFTSFALLIGIYYNNITFLFVLDLHLVMTCLNGLKKRKRKY